MTISIEALKLKVLKRIDETVPQLSDGTVSQYNVDEFLEEATMQILQSAPLHLVPSTKITALAIKNKDGSGKVALPTGFVRLIVFKMNGWERPVTSTITVHDGKYKRQFNKALRGGPCKPVVALVGNTLEYYSLPDSDNTHEIETAECVVGCKPTELPTILFEPLTWLTASLILNITNETEAATIARKRYDELIISLYGDNSL